MILDFSSSTELLTKMLRDASQVSAPLADEILDLASTFLFKLGFKRLRYYHLASETFPGANPERRLYLTWQRSSDPLLAAAPLPYTIKWSATTLSHHSEDTLSAPALEPVVESDYGALRGSVDERWVKDLALKGSSWVDIPVLDGRKMVGMVAADWPGDRQELDAKSTMKLTLFGAILGTELAGTSLSVAERLELQLVKRGSGPYVSLIKLLGDAVDVFQAAMQVGTASIFEFSWDRWTLTRSHLSLSEIYDADKEVIAELFPSSEVYKVGKNLTGCIWQDRDPVLILDYGELVSLQPNLRCGDILDIHELIGSPAHSIIYAPVSSENPRFLLRLINNAAVPGSPLLHEYDVLGEFVTDVSADLDRLLSSRRARAITDALDLLSHKVSPDEFCIAMAETLKDIEGLNSIFVIAHRQNERQPRHFFGLSAKTVARIRDEVLADPIYEETSRNGQTTFVVHMLSRGGCVSGLVRELNHSATSVGFFPFSSGNTRGVLGIPLLGPPREYDSDALPGRDIERFVSQMASTLGGCIESDFVTGQTEGAMQALRIVGHEMGTPLAILSNSTRVALDRAREVVRSIPRDAESAVPPTYFSSLQREVDRNIELLSAAIQMGVLVGRQSDRRIVGRRQVVEVRELISVSIGRVRKEIESGALLAPRNLRFSSPAVGSAVNVVVDRGLLASAIANLYRNAAKYSVEPARGTAAPIKTRVIVKDGSITILIENHGVEIPDHRDDVMFEAFTRLASRSSTRAIRGMGLGLYLARQIARSHGGDVSVATHDEVRGSSPTIYRTVFQISVASGLPEDDYEFLLDHKPAGTTFLNNEGKQRHG